MLNAAALTEPRPLARATPPMSPRTPPAGAAARTGCFLRPRRRRGRGGRGRRSDGGAAPRARTAKAHGRAGAAAPGGGGARPRSGARPPRRRHERSTSRGRGTAGRAQHGAAHARARSSGASSRFRGAGKTQGPPPWGAAVRSGDGLRFTRRASAHARTPCNTPPHPSEPTFLRYVCFLPTWPSLGRRRLGATSEVGPHKVTFGPQSTEFERCRSNVVRLGPNMARWCRSKLARLRQSWCKFGRSWPVDRRWPGVGQAWHEFEQIWAVLAKAGSTLTQVRPNLSDWPNAACLGRILARAIFNQTR